jgi:hypothetical protein
MWGALSDERTCLSFTRVTVSNNKSVASYVLTCAHSDFHVIQHGPHTGLRLQIYFFKLCVYSLPLESVYLAAA